MRDQVSYKQTMFGVDLIALTFFGMFGSVILFLVCLAIPFADRSSLLKKYSAREPEGLEDISVSGERLTADIGGHSLEVHIDETIQIHSSGSGTSRRRVHHIEVELTLPDFPKEITLSRDTVGSTFADLHGQKELTFDDPDFDNAFWVEAEDEAIAREFLTAERRSMLAYILGRRSFVLRDGILKYSKTHHIRFGVGSVAKAVHPARRLAAVLDGGGFPPPKPGFILRGQLRTWAIPALVLGLLGSACIPLSATHTLIVEWVRWFCLGLCLWLFMPLPGAKWLLRAWWPVGSVYAFASVLLLLWQGDSPWYQKIGLFAACSLLAIILWIAWRDISRRR